MVQLQDRRAFHLSVIYGLGAIITGALTIPAAIYLFFPPRVKKTANWVEAGDLAQMHPKIPEEVVFRRNRIDGWKVTSEKSTAWVVKTGEAEAVAFAPQCTHLGCAYHWDEQNKNFLCPCHTSTFGLDGSVLSGPAPRPLDRYEIKLAGTKLMLGEIKKSENA
ncbi:MAG TPA: ubiquinol-cytochrome c reductase iron-sulfur subunit [Bryobacteraceae bacterium]|nr:ubiquinol-cytochrome c reductase iron-sulfur subunit [Bryobacteraceae bacterium]